MAKPKLWQTSAPLEKITLDQPINVARGQKPLAPGNARDMLLAQFKAEGLRDRTVRDYLKYYDHFTGFTKLLSITDITADHIHRWLNSMPVSDSTKNIRLKALKAVLNRLYDRGYFASKLWGNIRIRIDKPVKQGTDPSDVQTLLSYLDLSDYFQLRDAVAVLLLYHTGIRSNTLIQLKETYIDRDNGLLSLPAGIMKNRDPLQLPLNDQTITLIQYLMTENARVRAFNGVSNEWLFISRIGSSLYIKGKSTVIQKRLYAYSKQYNMPNLGPHALRRAYARNLYDKGANIALISRALGHKSLEVTTRYLHIGNSELVRDLRDYMQ